MAGKVKRARDRRVSSTTHVLVQLVGAQIAVARLRNRWTEIRAEWLRNHAVLTAAEVAERAVLATPNATTILAEWEGNRRVFGLTADSQRLYPAFLFEVCGLPDARFHTLLLALDGKLGDWPLAMWLTMPNAEFEGWATPLEMMDRDPDAAAAAARIAVQVSSY